eukprot:TRINITY_DN4621_c0_g1_i1.p1 TRINITY_DN4621_c0_g1~~TRINITY_DN4621_c0_g1_i1.p1  ORF type:complete len:815 (+),score=129.19 TRINITY_DN4621_c0_g1_i1:50-2494(+)
MDESTAAQFWTSLAACDNETSWCKPPSSEVTLEGMRRGSTLLWEGYLEFQWGWRNQWQRRYVVVGKMFDGLTGYTASGATSWVFHFTDDSLGGKPKGCYHLSNNVANAKLLERNGRNTVVLISLPRNVDGTMDEPTELGFRSADEGDANELTQFSSVCVVTAREENHLARQFVRAFDRETYLDDAVDALPLDLLLFVRTYMRTQSAPAGEVGCSLLDWLHTRLIAVIECDGLNRTELCAAAKNTTAFLGAVAWELYSATTAPVGAEPRHVWKYISILQQYQLRQLVESAVFDDEAPEWMAQQHTSLHTEVFEVVHCNGVAYRSSPHYEDRIQRYDGPQCGTKFAGVRIRGIDNREYVRSCASPRGFLPVEDKCGSSVLRAFQGLEISGSRAEKDDDDFSQFRSPDHLWGPKNAPPTVALTWSQLLLRWALELPTVLTLQDRWDEMRERFTQSDDFLQDCWARRLQILHPDRFTTAEQYVGMLSPALEMVLAMGKCTTPVQKVRLWTESILQAASLINTFLPQGEVIGGEDLPSLVLFLTCHAECDNLAAQVEFGSLFILDPDGQDRDEFLLHPGSGFPERLANQIVLDADHRFISPYHYFAWVGDALDVVTTNEDGCISPRRSTTESPLSPRSPTTLTDFEIDELHTPGTVTTGLSPQVSFRISLSAPILQPESCHTEKLAQGAVAGDTAAASTGEHLPAVAEQAASAKEHQSKHPMDSLKPPVPTKSEVRQRQQQLRSKRDSGEMDEIEYRMHKNLLRSQGYQASPKPDALLSQQRCSGESDLDQPLGKDSTGVRGLSDITFADCANECDDLE